MRRVRRRLCPLRGAGWTCGGRKGTRGGRRCEGRTSGSLSLTWWVEWGAGGGRGEWEGSGGRDATVRASELGGVEGEGGA
jgi:hypothetical protein